MEKITRISNELLKLIRRWDKELLSLQDEVVNDYVNSQGRTIKQIVGHMCDTAMEAAQRIIHLQYQKCNVEFSNYSNLENNDNWLALQNFESEDWYNLVQLWKFSNMHLAHVIKNVKECCLEKVYVSAMNEGQTLEEIISEYPDHFKFHLGEIEDLIKHIWRDDSGVTPSKREKVIA